MKKKILLALLISMMIITQTACGSTDEPIQSENYYLDTACTISIYATDDSGKLNKSDANDAIDEAWELCALLDKTLSKTVDASDVSRINKAGGEWVEVSDYTVEVIEKSLRYSDLCSGAFDVSVGRLTDLWDYHATNPVVPDAQTITEALTHVNYRMINIDGNKIRLADPEAKLDLGGIAKGYIGDKMAELLEEKGISSAIINLGGNVVTIGCKPSGEPFNIGIEKPYSDRSELVGSASAENQTFVTSGVYERQFEVDGKIYHHILSTTTGYPVDTDLDSVTLVADKGRSADIDAMSTICLILGSSDGKAFIENQEGVEALFCLTDGTSIQTSGMEYTPAE